MMDYKKNEVRFSREWAMPSAWTFTIQPIGQLLQRYMGELLFRSGVWCDPFAGDNSPAQVRNDINPERNAEFHMDAIEFLKTRKDNEFDGILLDPPYSNRQVSEHYKAVGITPTGWHTSAGWGATLKDEAMRVVKNGGVAICFGWNSNGMGKKRGFSLIEIMLVAHGGGKNDTIVTVEYKDLANPTEGEEAVGV